MRHYAKYRSMLHHLLIIDEAIRLGTYPNTSTLARDLELSGRTVARKLEFLRDVLRAPIEYDPGRRGFYYTESNWSLPNIRVTAGDLLGLAMASMALTAYKGTRLGDYLEDVVGKLAAMLPDEVQVNPAELRGIFRFSLGPVAPINPEHWELLARAAQEHRTVEMRYYVLSKDKVTDRRVDPYLLRCYAGDWYLVGRDHSTGHVPMFSLARIKALHVTTRQFVVEDFDPDKYLEGTFQVSERSERHKVRILFSGVAAHIIAERVWHPSQKLAHRKDGSVLLSMIVADLNEVSRWVLTWGPEARVLQPRKLADSVRDAAVALARQYAEPGNPAPH